MDRGVFNQRKFNQRTFSRSQAQQSAQTCRKRIMPELGAESSKVNYPVLIRRNVFLDLVLYGERGCFGTIGKMQLAQHVTDVVADRAFPKKQPPGDLAVGQ